MGRLVWLALGASAAAFAILATWWALVEISFRMLGEPDAERLQRLELGYERQLLIERLRRSGMPPSDAEASAVSRETRGGP